MVHGDDAVAFDDAVSFSAVDDITREFHFLPLPTSDRFVDWLSPPSFPRKRESRLALDWLPASRLGVLRWGAPRTRRSSPASVGGSRGRSEDLRSQFHLTFDRSPAQRPALEAVEHGVDREHYRERDHDTRKHA